MLRTENEMRHRLGTIQISGNTRIRHMYNKERTVSIGLVAEESRKDTESE